MTQLRVLTQFQHLNAIMAAKSSFEQTNPGITVVVEQAADFFETQQAYKSDTPPDIIETGGYPIMDLEGYYIDLNPYIKEEIGLEEDLFPGLLRVARHGGRLPALPVEVMPPLILYNKELFDRAGVAYPAEDWTWDEMVEIAKRLTIRDEQGVASQFGLNIGDIDVEWFEPFVMRNGGSYVSPDGSSARGYADSTATIEAFRKIVDAYRVHQVIRKPGEQIHKGAWYEAFAMTLAFGWFADNLLNTHKLEPKFGAAGLPRMPGDVEANMVYMGGAGVTNKSPNPRLAWAFLRHYLVDCHSWMQPITQSQAEARGLTRHPVWSRYMKELDHVQLSGYYLSKKWNASRQLVNEDILRMIVDGADVAHTLRSWTRFA